MAEIWKCPQCGREAKLVAHQDYEELQALGVPARPGRAYKCECGLGFFVFEEKPAPSRDSIKR